MASNAEIRAVVLIVDGLGDLPVPQLQGKTPLEAAHTPHLDRWASAGRYGQIDPLSPGVTPNTDSGTGMLMGLSPAHADRLRRGPVEAAGVGYPLKNGDVAMRANFATVCRSGQQDLVTDRRAGRIEHDVPTLIAALSAIDTPPGVSIHLRATDQHRAVLVISASGLDGNISDTDPGYEQLPAPMLRSLATRPQAEHTAEILNHYLDAVKDLLQGHDVNHQRAAQGKPLANALITRGAGQALEIGNVIRDAGWSAAVVAGCNTVCGLACMFGFEVIRDARFTATRNTDIEAKIQAAIAALQKHDLVFVHFKAPDLCAHDHQPLVKKLILERFDAALAPLLELEVIIACAADHCTDSNSGKHTAEPVPALLYSPHLKLPVQAVKFGESACRAGNMLRQNSSSFLQEVLQQMQGS